MLCTLPPGSFALSLAAYNLKYNVNAHKEFISQEIQHRGTSSYVPQSSSVPGLTSYHGEEALGGITNKKTGEELKSIAWGMPTEGIPFPYCIQRDVGCFRERKIHIWLSENVQLLLIF